MPEYSIVALTLPSNYNILQPPQRLHEKFDHYQIVKFEPTTPTPHNRVVKCTQHVPISVVIC